MNVSTLTSVPLLILLLWAVQDSHSVTPTPMTVALQSSHDGLEMRSNVSQIQPSATKSLQVECYMNATSASDVASLVSVLLLKWNDAGSHYDELVSINVFNPRTVNVVNKMGGQEHGWLNSDRAFLSLHWDYPSEVQSGRYMCEANALDKVGHTINVSTNLTIGLVQTDSAVLTEAVRSLREELVNLTGVVRDMNSTINNQRWQLLSAESQIEDLKDNVVRPHLFTKTWVQIDGQMLYFTNAAYYSFDAAQTACTLIGGKLAELSPYKVKSEASRLKARGYNFFAWMGALYMNGTSLYPSTGRPADFSLHSTPNIDPSCFILGPDIINLYTVPCTGIEGYSALCTV